jgi:hypothetical protein
VPHLAYFKPGGIWVDLAVPGGAAFTYFDQTLARCIDGDEGGVWAPAQPIQVGGQGIRLVGVGGAWTPTTPLEIAGRGVWLTGGTVHQVRGQNTRLSTQDGGRFLCADNDVPLLQPPRTRILRMPPWPVHRANAFGALVEGPGACRLEVQNAGQGDVAQIAWLLNPYLHDGARLTSIDVLYTVTANQLPQLPPVLQGVRHAVEVGQPPAPPAGLTSGVVPFPLPGDVNAWAAGGRVQAFTYTPTANNVIQRASAVYELRFELEPRVPGAMSITFHGFDLTFSDITDLRWA